MITTVLVVLVIVAGSIYAAWWIVDWIEFGIHYRRMKRDPVYRTKKEIDYAVVDAKWRMYKASRGGSDAW